MAVESALIKPVVDAIMKLLKLAGNARLTKQTEKKVQEAIRDLLLANPDENKAEAALLAARAANLLSPDVLFAEQMLKRVRSTKRMVVKKKVAAKKAVRKKVVKKKTAGKHMELG